MIERINKLCFASMFGFVLALTLSVPVLADGKRVDEVAIFAGGCFWCVESDFDKVLGVKATVSGFIGGTIPNPSYKMVSAGGSGYIEAVKITYDPMKVTYDQLLHIFWRSVDPTDAKGQFCDRGDSYVTAIFATNEKQKKLAEASKTALDKSKRLSKPIATHIRYAGRFFAAEDYHQNYYKKNPLRYNFFRFKCGRDAGVRAIWGDEAHAGIPHS